MYERLLPKLRRVTPKRVTTPRAEARPIVSGTKQKEAKKREGEVEVETEEVEVETEEVN